mgnify:CR=1 FL=1
MYIYVKFIYSENATKIWKNLILCFDATKKFHIKVGDIHYTYSSLTIRMNSSCKRWETYPVLVDKN